MPVHTKRSRMPVLATRRSGAKGLLIGAVALVTVAVSSCQAEETTPLQPYAAQFQQELEDSSSDFVRSVLEDNGITAAEFAESQERFVSCLTDAGFEPVQVDAVAGFTSYTQVSLPSEQYESEAAMDCETKWVGGIQGLYVAMLQNPENENFWDLIAECLADESLVPEGTRGKDIEDAISRAGTMYETSETDEPTVVRGPEDPDATLPGGLRWDDPQLSPCMANPLNPTGQAS